MVVVLVTAASLAACGSGSHRPRDGAGASRSSGTPIAIKNFAFSPADLTVSPGATATVRHEYPTTLAWPPSDHTGS